MAWLFPQLTKIKVLGAIQEVILEELQSAHSHKEIIRKIILKIQIKPTRRSTSSILNNSIHLCKIFKTKTTQLVFLWACMVVILAIMVILSTIKLLDHLWVAISSLRRFISSRRNSSLLLRFLLNN